MDIAWLIYDAEDIARNRYFIDRVQSYFSEHGIDVELVDGTRLPIDEGPSVLPIFAINRGRDPSVAGTLEKLGIRVFNSSTVNRYANDKFATYLLAKSLDIPVIETDLLRNSTGPKFPCVIKSRSGHGGSEVFLVRDGDELESIADSFGTQGYIVQPVASTVGRDLRVYAVGNSIVAGVMRSSEDGEFRSNYSLGGRAELVEVPDDVRETVMKILNRLKPDFIGIDFVINDGSYVLNEIEDPVGSRMLYDVSDTDIIGLFMDHVLKNYREDVSYYRSAPWFEELRRGSGCEIKDRIHDMVAGFSMPASKPINGIGMNRRTADYIGVVQNEELFVHCEKTGKTAQMRTTILDENEDFAISLRKDFFMDITDGAPAGPRSSICFLAPFKQEMVSKIKPQPIGKIDQDTIYVSNSMYDRISKIDSYFFALRHLTYGFTLIVKKSNIKPDENAKDGQISLSKYQRILVGADESLHMAIEHLENMDDPDGSVQKDISWLKETVSEKKEFAERSRISECISGYGIGKYSLFPLFWSSDDHLSESRLTKISNFFIGNGQLTLRSCRPYSGDDGSRIIRMSYENMKMIGIDESDQAILETGYYSAKVRVFSFENEDLARETNNFGRVFNNQAVVGVPVNLRKEINLSDVGSTVRVKRDTAFILKKNLNIQMISIILFFISLFQVFVTVSEPLAAVAYSLLMIAFGYPLILYMTLSRERNRVRQK